MLQEMLETLEERFTTNYRECACPFFLKGERDRELLIGCVKYFTDIFVLVPGTAILVS